MDRKRFVSIVRAALVLSSTAVASSLAAAPPPNDDFANAIELEGSSGRTVGWNVEAGLEPGEPLHGGVTGGASVWWRWVATSTGAAKFDTFGSGFDTLLSVYTGDSLRALTTVAMSDDSGLESQSSVLFPAQSGTVYHIAVDGFFGDAGAILLSWQAIEPAPCREPGLPVISEPVDGAHVLGRTVKLEWTATRPIERDVIYGADDRRDFYQISDPDLIPIADATVALVPATSLGFPRAGSYRLNGAALRQLAPFCATERYLDQPSIASCTGFLVAPDLVATAGHCIELGDPCGSTAIIFGYRMLDAATPALDIPESQVYFCEEVVASAFDPSGDDWAILRLDREVDDHEPLPIRREGRLGDRDALVVAGYPLGLPLKIAGGAHVFDNTPDGFFSADLDIFGGNSGSPVVNRTTLEVEGILVRGFFTDFVENGDCIESLECTLPLCGGVESTRTTVFSFLLPAEFQRTHYEVKFGSCAALELAGTTEARSWTLTDLKEGEAYCWQVDAVTACGRAPGPVWSFFVGSGTELRRGALSRAENPGLTDAVLILGWLFLELPPPGCLDAADVDDSGTVNLSDAIYLLRWLFASGPNPPFPSATCGRDPTPDALDCVVPPICP